MSGVFTGCSEPGALTPSARFEKGQLYYVVSDHQGTVREILTEDGELIWAGRAADLGRSRVLAGTARGT
ncbi:hypothetical protein [Photorhabdus temperata]|uniref:hypothetical protein n=1 Tax=Photorhabdus temperata TaxID=574560 RepID=UPI00041A8160|nr:hypothetical protein [Photorhabdus temperata]